MSTLEPVVLMGKDIKAAASSLGVREARFLVDSYYMMQDERLRAESRVRVMRESDEPEPCTVLEWFLRQRLVLENQVKTALASYAKGQRLGVWAMSICGIGPVIAAGLLAHVDCTVPTCGKVWRYAGLDPTVRWQKGEKRPWNAMLKTLAWKIGESFVKVSGKPNDIYGKLYLQRKELEARNNEALRYKDQAADVLKRVPQHAQKATYETGILPASHIHMRAKRWVVKLFLSHYHAVGHFLATGQVPPRPYVIDILKHIDMIYPPNMEMIPGLKEAYDRQ